jgi:hypothetical protein
MSALKFSLSASLALASLLAVATRAQNCDAPLAPDHPSDGTLTLTVLNSQLPSQPGLTVVSRRISAGRGLPGMLAIATTFTGDTASIDLIPAGCAGDTVHLVSLPTPAAPVNVAVSQTCDVVYFSTRAGGGSAGTLVYWHRVSTGEQGVLPAAALDAPSGLAVSPDGRLLYCSDSGNQPTCSTGSSDDKVVRWRINDCLSPPRFVLDPTPITEVKAPPNDDFHDYADVTVTGPSFGAASDLVIFSCAAVPGVSTTQCGGVVPLTPDNFDNLNSWNGSLGLFSPGNPTTTCPDERIGRIAAGGCHLYGTSGHKVYAFTPDGTGHALVAIFSGISDIEVGANDQLFIVDIDKLYTVTSGCETCPN